MTISYQQRDNVLDITTYPSGETHVQIKDWVVHLGRDRTGEVCPHFVIEWPARTWTDVMNLVTTDQALIRLNVPHTFFLPYLPFARDDRRRSRGCGNELDVAIDMLKLPQVVIADPHSYVSEVLPYISAEAVAGVVDAETDVFSNRPIILIPDRGARHKVMSWAAGRFNIAQGDKHRDPSTGALDGFEINCLTTMKDREVVIVDDICDGGGTFLGLLELARMHEPAKVSLVVTHGLFTKGLECLDGFDHIVTFGTKENRELRMTTIPWKTLYLESNPR